MSIRKLKTLLWLPLLGLSIGGPLAVAWSLFWPCPMDLPPTASTADPRPQTASHPQPEAPPLSLAQFGPLWQRPLRRPLYDPPPPKPSSTTTRKPIVPARRPTMPSRKPPTPPVLLVGTIIEPGHSMAIVQVAQGKVELKAVGDLVGPKGAEAQVERVDPQLLVLRRQQELIHIPIQDNQKKAR